MLTQDKYLALLKEVADEVRNYPDWMRLYIADRYGSIDTTQGDGERARSEDLSGPAL